MQPKTLNCSAPDFAGDGQHTITYYQWGDDGAPTVLCVHGLTRNARDFDFLAQRLAQQGKRVLCPDMPGRGKSQWLEGPANYTYPAHVADLQFFIKHLNLTSADWIGTSMGGILGMMIANALPGFIQSLVLNDIGTIVSAEGLKRIASYSGAKTIFDTRAEAEAAVRERWSTFGIHEEAHWQHLFTYGIQSTADGKFRFAYDPKIFQARPADEAITDIDLSALWEAVTKIPVLLIRGEESDLLTRETARSMQALHPDLTLYEVPNAGHAPALMSAAEMDEIAGWMKRKHPG